MSDKFDIARVRVLCGPRERESVLVSAGVGRNSVWPGEERCDRRDEELPFRVGVPARLVCHNGWRFGLSSRRRRV
jgi:hypothetical protein